jgi:hypothetical protein
MTTVFDFNLVRGFGEDAPRFSRKGMADVRRIDRFRLRNPPNPEHHPSRKNACITGAFCTLRTTGKTGDP